MGKACSFIILMNRCSASCSVEIGYVCTGGTSSSKDTCEQICGDGKIMNTRPSLTYCDDGNVIQGDGCSSDC